MHPYFNLPRELYLIQFVLCEYEVWKFPGHEWGEGPWDPHYDGTTTDSEEAEVRIFHFYICIVSTVL